MHAAGLRNANDWSRHDLVSANLLEALTADRDRLARELEAVTAERDRMREVLKEIIRITDEETIPDRHGKPICSCPRTRLTECGILAREVIGES